MDPDPTIKSALNQGLLDLIGINNRELENFVVGPMDVETSCETPLAELPSDIRFKSQLDQANNKRRAETVEKEMENISLIGSPCKKLKVDNAICSFENNLGIDEILNNLKVLIACDFSQFSKAKLLTIKSSLEGHVNALKKSLSITEEPVNFNGIAYERSNVLNTLEKVVLVIKSIEINFLPVELTTHPTYIKKATQIAIKAGFSGINKDSKFGKDFLHLAVREFMSHYLSKQESTYLFRPCSSLTSHEVIIMPQVLNFSYGATKLNESLAKINSTFKKTMIDCSFFVISSFENSHFHLTHRIMAYNMESVNPEYYFCPEEKIVNNEKFNSLEELIAVSPNLKPYIFKTTPYDAYSKSLSAMIENWTSSK